MRKKDSVYEILAFFNEMKKQIHQWVYYYP